jgi:hypothetical protein
MPPVGGEMLDGKQIMSAGCGMIVVNRATASVGVVVTDKVSVRASDVSCVRRVGVMDICVIRVAPVVVAVLVIGDGVNGITGGSVNGIVGTHGRVERGVTTASTVGSHSGRRETWDGKRDRAFHKYQPSEGSPQGGRTGQDNGTVSWR